ncbi:MarR family winged helix-turn-helix transcriptional regulator, partial [Nocardia farcinica]|uniref:MarR family winged helix-turn-helix transcriptional regulator n=1 Tax=Nocardia farcinica TaxID=37329 RepID=UPI002454814D
MSTETATTLLKLLVHATRSYEHTLEQALRPALDERLRPAHFAVFRYLDPEGSRITALAEAAGMTQQSMGELVTHLEACGYVERRVDPADPPGRGEVGTPPGGAARRRGRRGIEGLARGRGPPRGGDHRE